MPEDPSLEIAPCFLLLKHSGKSDQFADQFRDRLESRGIDVELIEFADLSDSLSLDHVDSPSEWADRLTYPMVLLQKHGIVPVLNHVHLSGNDLGPVDQRLENLLVVGPADGGLDTPSVPVLTVDYSSEDAVEEVLSSCEERGLFDRPVSEKRSDEEVTDRLKNLGYI